MYMINLTLAPYEMMCTIASVASNSECLSLEIKHLNKKTNVLFLA